MRRCSIAVQRSITTGRPASCAICAASQLTTPSCIHSAPEPVAAALRAISGVCSGRRNTSTMSNGPVAATAASSECEGRRAQDLGSVGVDRDHVVALVEEVAHHAVRRPHRVRRRTDDGDPARTREQFAGSLRVEERLPGRCRPGRPSRPRAVFVRPSSGGCLAFVGLAIGRGRNAAANDPGKDDDRHQVRQRVVELWRDRLEEVAHLVVRRGERDRASDRVG